MTFEEWILGEMDLGLSRRGLSQLEIDQMLAAWNAALATANERIMELEAEREAMAKQEPVAWRRVARITDMSTGVFETQDVELRTERLEPLFAHPAPIPDGFALVPKDPTQEMLVRGKTEHSQWGMMQAEAVWRAMIDAARKP